jgi:hypothetical protein
MREIRPLEGYDHNAVSRPNGRSESRVQCPFCHQVIYVSTWSFYGCGKKCGCGAKLGIWQCIKEVDL